MSRYSKTYSNYVLRKRHQTLEDGSTIFERDWGTLGERHVIEPGKRRIYSDSNFLFTDNTQLGIRYRNNTGDWSEPFTQETLGDTIDTTVNDTSLLDESNDIRDYAYYGSAVELVRSSIENIIKWFPGRFWSTDSLISRLSGDGEQWLYMKDIISDGHHNYAVQYTDDKTQCNVFIVRNPFTIDFYNTNFVPGKYDNILRNMPMSYKRYTMNGGEITKWNVWAKPYSDCDENYTIKYDIEFKSDDLSGHIYGFNINGNVVWVTSTNDMVVQPKQEEIDNYFKGLNGFEAKILNRNHHPKYTTKLITPISYGNNNPNYMYVERSYTWPHDGYCLSVDTIAFENYVGSLYDLASIMDELWCDNIWKRMTHESITNFDWTYTKEYEEGQEEENILGGTRMEEILRIWGRCFDDIKRYVDGISLKNVVTYEDSVPNLGNAELSDKAGLLGWEVYSTKPEHGDNIYLTNEFIDSLDKLNQEDRWLTTPEMPHPIVSYEKWYNSRNPESISQNDVDNDFMKRLVLSTSEIFRTKGTKQGLEMVFSLFGIGSDEYSFIERYYSVIPKLRYDLFYFYRLDLVPNPINYENVVPQPYNTLKDYLADHPAKADSPQYIIVGGQNYKLIDGMTVGDFCKYLIDNKTANLNYDDDEFSGTPIKDVYIANQHYIVPYFTQDEIYDGNVYFESKGGWGKYAGTDYDFDVIKTQEYDYLETIPYMETVQNVGELLQSNVFQIGNKKIFYVMDISDLSEYDSNIPGNISHFFKLQNQNNPNNFNSWKNVPFFIIENNEAVPIDEYCHGDTSNYDTWCDNSGYDIFNGITYEDYQLAQYNDRLSADSLGNNPHCGYAEYDMGTEYLEYLRLPFKNAIDNYGFLNIEDAECAEQFTFEVTEHTGEKIVNLINEYVEYDDSAILYEGDDYYTYMNGYYELNTLYNVPIEGITAGELKQRESLDSVYYRKQEYYLPSKLLIIRNRVDSDLYRDYFKKIITKYLLQVIPSTTILMFDEKKSYFINTEITSSLDITNFTSSICKDNVFNFNKRMCIFVVPKESTAILEYTSGGIKSVVGECDTQECLVDITDQNVVRNLPNGYKILQYVVTDPSGIETAKFIIK